MNDPRQDGWTLAAVLGVIASAAIGAYCFDFLLKLVPNDVQITVPWVLITLFILPLTFAVQLLIKTWEINDEENLSRDEKRRLKVIVDEKIRQIWMAIIYYVLGAVVVAALFVFSSADQNLFRVTIQLTGGLLAISVFSVFLILSETHKLSKFRTKLKARADERKRQRAALKRMKQTDSKANK